MNYTQTFYWVRVWYVLYFCLSAFDVAIITQKIKYSYSTLKELLAKYWIEENKKIKKHDT